MGGFVGRTRELDLLSGLLGAVDSGGRPHVFFTAVGGSLTHDLAGFAEPRTWDAAFGLLAQVLPASSPSVVVLEEMPYLAREDLTFEGTSMPTWSPAVRRSSSRNGPTARAGGTASPKR